MHVRVYVHPCACVCDCMCMLRACLRMYLFVPVFVGFETLFACAFVFACLDADSCV